MNWGIKMLMNFFDFIFNIDQNLLLLMNHYGSLIYVIIFAIIFIETGLVIVPFLPGDSVIFACGAFAAAGSMSLYILFPLIIIAAIVGDSINYVIGKHLGNKIVDKLDGKLISRKNINKTEAFYEKHGGATIFLARFVPIIRTFAPFVAGISKMEYKKFITYNIIGGITWSTLFLLIGFFFGNIPFVKDHFSIVILLIIAISLLPVLIPVIKNFFKAKHNRALKK